MPNEKFASEIFFPANSAAALCCIAKGSTGSLKGVRIAGEMLQTAAYQRFRDIRTETRPELKAWRRTIGPR